MSSLSFALLPGQDQRPPFRQTVGLCVFQEELQ